MTRLVLIERRVQFDIATGVRAETQAHVYSGRKRIATFAIDPNAPTLLADIEWARTADHQEMQS